MKGMRLTRPLRIVPLDALGGYLCRYLLYADTGM